MTTVVSILSHYRCHSHATGANDNGSESKHSLPLSWCNENQRYARTDDTDNGNERYKAFPEKQIWRLVDDDNSSERPDLIPVVMGSKPAMTTVATVSLITIVIKLNKVLRLRAGRRILQAVI